MRQRITHGAELDIATPAEIADLVAAAFDHRAIEDYDHKRNVLALDGAGAGQDALAVPAQYDWILQRITLTGGAGAVVEIFENSQSGADLLETVVLGAGGRYSDAFSNSIHVQANSKVLIVVTGGGAGGQATYNLQLKLLHKRRGV